MGAEMLDNEAEHCDCPTAGWTAVVQPELPQSSGLACGIQSIWRLQVNPVPSSIVPRRVGYIEPADGAEARSTCGLPNSRQNRCLPLVSLDTRLAASSNIRRR